MPKTPSAGARPLIVDASGSPSATKRYARTVLGMTFALMALDFIDRQVVVVAFPYLKTEWGLSDTQLGALVSVVSITVAVGALPAGLSADRWSRVKAISMMGVTWSLATLASGFAQDYARMFTARAAVGLGEAGYAPAAGALLSSGSPQIGGPPCSEPSRPRRRSERCSALCSAGFSPWRGGGGPCSAWSGSPA